MAKKTFAAFERYKGEWVVAFKAERARQQFLIDVDPRCYASPYVGKHGWVSMRVEAGVPRRQLESLVKDSYRLVAPPKKT